MWEYLTEISRGTPKITLAFILLLGFLIYNFVKNETFRKSVLNDFHKFSSDKINLLKHDLFQKQEYFDSAANNIYFENEPVKTDLFRILLEQKIHTSVEFTKEFISNKKLKNIDNSVLFFDLSLNVEKIIDTYEKRIFEQFKLYFVAKNYSLKDAKAIAHQQYNLLYSAFEKNHNKNVAFILKSLKRNTYSSAFSLEQKLYFYLNLIDLALEIAITDCEDTFAKLNGGVGRIIDKYNNK